jgi:outer membrane protein OmpA-like peptidoglycan-associated protein
MNKQIKTYIAMLMGLVSIVVLCLSGCTNKKDISVYIEKSNTVAGPTRDQFIQLLQGIDIPVMQKTDEMVIALSNKKLFQKDSVELKSGNIRVLQVIALLMRKDQKDVVNVVSYTDQANAALAEQQVRYISQLLWEYKIDARLLHTNTVVTNQLPWECGRIKQCTLIRYHYFTAALPYN